MKNKGLLVFIFFSAMAILFASLNDFSSWHALLKVIYVFGATFICFSTGLFVFALDNVEDK